MYTDCHMWCSVARSLVDTVYYLKDQVKDLKQVNKSLVCNLLSKSRMSFSFLGSIFYWDVSSASKMLLGYGSVIPWCWWSHWSDINPIVFLLPGLFETSERPWRRKESEKTLRKHATKITTQYCGLKLWGQQDCGSQLTDHCHSINKNHINL